MTRPNRLLLPLLTLLLPLATGCALGRSSINQPVPAAALERLVPGKSTAADVVAELGAPVDVVQLGKRSAYRFEHQRSKNTGLFLLVVIVFNQDTRQDRVWAFFDENDVLTHFGATLTAKDARYALPWQDIHE